MAITVNGDPVDRVLRNGGALNAVTYNGTEVFPAVTRSGSVFTVSILADALRLCVYYTAHYDAETEGELYVRFSFGDGSTLAADVSGAESGTSWRVQHTFSQAGTYTVTVTADEGVTWKAGARFDGTSYPVMIAEDSTVSEHSSEGSPIVTAVLDGAVTGLNDYAFSDGDSTESVKLSYSVASIGNYAFSGCTGLTDVFIPNSVTSIGYDAFYHCASLTDIIIPDSAETLGTNMFSGCVSLVTAVLPRGITEIPSNMFFGCRSLVYSIPDTVETIGFAAFGGCTSLAPFMEIKAATVYPGAFSYCTQLLKVWLRDSVEYVWSMAFTGCDPSLILYAECAEADKPNGWHNGFNRYGIENDEYLTVVWNQGVRPWGDEWAVQNGDVLYLYRAYNAEQSGDVLQIDTPAEQYLTFSSPSSFTLATANTAKNWDGTLEYSADTESWSEWDGTTTLSAEADDGSYYLYLRGTDNTVITGGNNRQFVLTGNSISCLGNTETLLDYSTVISGSHPTAAARCFQRLFYNCTSLISAPSVGLASVPAYGCYGMFDGCTSLTTAPSLPATTLASDCYEFMFYRCSALVSAPALPATVLPQGTYQFMFSDCTSLTEPPVLSHVTDMGLYCISGMFDGCTNLEKIPALNALIWRGICAERTFAGCTKIKLSKTQTGEYQTPIRFPATGTATMIDTAETTPFINTFYQTGGTLNQDYNDHAELNTTYYTSNTIV